MEGLSDNTSAKFQGAVIVGCHALQWGFAEIRGSNRGRERRRGYIMKTASRRPDLWFIIVVLASLTGLAHSHAFGDSDDPFTVVSKLSHDDALAGAHDVELSGDLAFVPGKGGSLAVIDVTDPEKPEVLWFKRNAQELQDSETVLPIGKHLLLGTRDFFSLDVSRPRKPVFLKKVADRSCIDRINGMVCCGKIVFAANKTGWIDAFDVGDITSPELFGAMNVRERHALDDPHDVDVFGKYIVIVCPNKFGGNPTGQLAVFKVMNEDGGVLPADQWSLEGLCESEKLIGANRVQISGSYAYTGGSWSPEARKTKAPGTSAGLGVVDLSDPKEPEIVASLPFSDARGPNGLTVVGKVVFLAGGQTVDAVGISDPLHPFRLGSHTFPPLDPRIKRTDNAHDLVYRDGHLYVSCQSDNSFVVLRVNDSRILKLANFSRSK